MISPNHEVLVIGAGHAGCEAALASARMGAKTALITMQRPAVARMSCNPSIGGIAKSHIVCELDALGGEMARNADFTGIQFRTLNTRKGLAVQAFRVQCDKHAYSQRMLAIVEQTENLTLIEASVGVIWTENGRLRGIVTEDGTQISAEAVILASGTFLKGVIHIGKQQSPGGRKGEASSDKLSDSLLRLGFRMARLKTGTPPRIHKDSIDWSRTEIQPGETPPPFFSAAARAKWQMFHVEQMKKETNPSGLFHVEQSTSDLEPWPVGTNQMPCYLTHTTAETHQIIRDNLGLSAMYGGSITGTGVRYCPSIEDKIVKFSDRDQHHVFLEPEGRNSIEIYPNGTSNSLPEAVQTAMIRSIPGMERAVFTNLAYAIEYDFCDPTQLLHTLETKRIEHLYFAGQPNGTTGYEEAAGQGFVAGVNAVLKLRKLPPFVLGRGDAYIGVLIDDLVTKGTSEPYRMFTSRAEHRLILRQDNAIFRMLPFAKAIGILDPLTLERVEKMESDIWLELKRLASTFVEGQSLASLLRRTEIHYSDLPSRQPLDPQSLEQVEIMTKYQGYISREQQQIERGRLLETQPIPDWIDYDRISTLRFECREKLKQIRPESIGQAARISGVTPADISILAVIIKRGPVSKAPSV
jgi:tRNA uridine 5-carboxymethylaminomethyl modification enzyme